MDQTPEELLGLPVEVPDGRRIGIVVDVGLYSLRQPKFLLVQGSDADAPLVRVDVDDVAEVGSTIRLTAAPRRRRLPT